MDDRRYTTEVPDATENWIREALEGRSELSADQLERVVGAAGSRDSTAYLADWIKSGYWAPGSSR